jgi:hypothetical protein
MALMVNWHYQQEQTGLHGKCHEQKKHKITTFRTSVKNYKLGYMEDVTNRKTI